MYVLKFEPVYKEKVWGGRRLAQFGRDVPPGKIGESWELVDVNETAVSGGGGGAAHSIVANGPLKGRTIRELLTVHRDAILGDRPLWPDGGFPLLVKLLDAEGNLSVQVHPSPEFAASHPDARIKSEAWYIIDAEDDAVLYIGLKLGVSPDDLRAAIADNTVPELMHAVPAVPGECHYLPSGTCHALGAGILVAEVQTPSDTTFRVYDWGRTDRELHIESALACIDFSNPAPAAVAGNASGLGTAAPLASCEFFHWERRVIPTGTYANPAVATPAVWMVLEGEALFTCGGVETSLGKADTALLPATPPDQLHCSTDLTVLIASLPATAPE